MRYRGFLSPVEFRKGFLAAVLLLFYFSSIAQQESLIKYVNPLIGTDRMGHTYPGATVPFGTVQLSPETDTLPYEVNGHYNKDVYKYCAGYQYHDKTIVGFSHTHFSGTGHSDLGDFLIMPTTGPLQINPGTADHPESGFRSGFSHSTEVAAPDYYKVKLDRYNILAELTTTTRVGIHQYTFPQSDNAHIILDAVYGIYNYPDKNVWTYIRVENDTLVTGYRQTNGWGRTRTVYFAMTFSKPFKEYGWQNSSKKQVYRGFWRKFNQEKNFPEMAGTQVRAYFDFNTVAGEQIKIKFAISPVSTVNALENLRRETPGWDFNEIKTRGQNEWERELKKITIEADKETKENFYTAVYHAYINPTVYMDANGEYRGLDQNAHRANFTSSPTQRGFTNYTTFSLWDTYRALHPLFNMIQPRRNADMISSLLAHYDQSVHHMLPVWSNSANENWCMIGYHSVSVIADAYVKGNTGFDANRALDACIATAKHKSYDGLEYYMSLGYVPEDKNSSSVSKTLEYAYDDWCIAMMAKKLGREDAYVEFIKRSGNFKNVYDPSTGFMRPRMSDGSFKKDFDVLNTDEPGFIEGNTWNYSLYVPHVPQVMIEMMGGDKVFTRHLDSLFTMQLPDSFFAKTEDITRDGIIGNYVHGNEPSHHIAYLYNWTSKPWKTQERVRMIMKKMYKPTPDGLSGNDDCGQMSAWYIFSALGFYPVAPGSDAYELGSPSVSNAVLHLENGKTFTVQTKNQSDKNVYVQKVELNGKVLNVHSITHTEIMNGGDFVFYMSNKHAK
jgi:predicted alpha-1,2-mannosidase